MQNKLNSIRFAFLIAVLLIIPACGYNHTNERVKPENNAAVSKQSGNLPRPDHVVIVVEENHSKEQIIGNEKAPYINSLVKEGALFTNSHGVQHPSQANYIALFSGDTQGVTNDECPHSFSTENLSTELRRVNETFTGFSEDLPSVGFKGCSHKSYMLKHNPWVNFTNVPEKENQPFTSFPSDFSKLPTVSFVIPNQMNDMHDGTIQQADTWLKRNMDRYVQWAKRNNSLLIVTWDEDDFKDENLIPTIFVGPMVKNGKYDEFITHYHVLRTLEDMYGLNRLGKTKDI
jgi:phosphatidylinositol-3-phosphatase